MSIYLTNTGYVHKVEYRLCYNKLKLLPLDGNVLLNSKKTTWLVTIPNTN